VSSPRKGMAPLLLAFSAVALLSFGSGVQAVADRSLYLTVNKPFYVLGETVMFTVHIGKDSCKQHGHVVDIYVYDSKSLEDYFRVEKVQGLALQPWDFPINASYTPQKVDVYTAKLWVIHTQTSGHPQAYVEDTVAFTVAAYTITASWTTTVVTTRTMETVVTAQTTVTVTTTARESVTVQLEIVAIVLIASAVAAVTTALIMIVTGRRKRK